MKSFSIVAAVFFTFIALQQNSHGRQTVELVGLVDTNNPASALATLTLSDSNLHMIVDVPPGSTRLTILCSSNEFILGNSIWTYVQIQILRPPRTNSFPPPIIPDPRNEQSNVVVVIPQGNVPILSQAVSAETLLSSSIFQTSTPPTISSAPLRSPTRPGGGTNSVFPLLSPRLTNEIALTEEQAGYFRDGFGVMQFDDTNNVVAVTAFIRQVDGDSDGVPDSRDVCPGTLRGSIVDANGCSIDQLVPCDANWKNHGTFVNAFRAVSAEFLRSGLINARQFRDLNRFAAQADCGK